MQTPKIVALRFDPISAESTGDPRSDHLIKESTIGLIQSEALEGLDAFEGLGNKYDRPLRNESDKKQALFVHQFAPTLDGRAIESDAGFFIDDDVQDNMRNFTSGEEDVGLYLISNFYPGDKAFSRKAFDAKALAETVNRLPFVPKKICVVSCKFSSQEAKDAGINEFLKHLKVDPLPVVASYSYVVSVNQATGKKDLVVPLSRRGIPDPKRYTKEELLEKAERHRNYKTYYVPDPVTGKYVQDDRHVYTDNKEIPIKENQSIVQLRLKSALGITGNANAKQQQFDPLKHTKDKYKVVYVGAENIYFDSGIAMRPFYIPKTEFTDIELDKIKANDQLHIHSVLKEGTIKTQLATDFSMPQQGESSTGKAEESKAHVELTVSANEPSVLGGVTESTTFSGSSDIAPPNISASPVTSEGALVTTTIDEVTAALPLPMPNPRTPAADGLEASIRAAINTHAAGKAVVHTNDIRRGGPIPPNAVAVTKIGDKGQGNEKVLVLHSCEGDENNRRNIYTILTVRQAAAVGRLSMYKNDIEKHRTLEHLPQRNSATVPQDSASLDTKMDKLRKAIKNVFKR